ncbi:hypothetical protein IJJ49_01080, partial [Candidatus Saccharibacteria bacterium]|nr:hypothetical protein [Candidatus Saccharibacteria bacterium]
CETGFKDDIKNTLLSRVMLKKPKLVKPLSIIIEVFSVLIVIVAVWAILTAIKSLLALWALGSCNVTKPSACSLGAEVCSIDESEPTNVFEATGRWFTEWGEIFEAIPEKFKNYNPEDYNFNYIVVPGEGEEKTVVVDILDPGCSVCLRSFLNQKAAGFFDEYEVRLVPFAIQDTDDNYKFRNSGIIVRYVFAAEEYQAGLGTKILEHIFEDKNADGISYQNLMNNDLSYDEAEEVILGWLKEAGIHSKERAEIKERANGEEIGEKMAKNREIVENELKVKGIPTMIIDWKKTAGLWKAE